MISLLCNITAFNYTVWIAVRVLSSVVVYSRLVQVAPFAICDPFTLNILNCLPFAMMNIVECNRFREVPYSTRPYMRDSLQEIFVLFEVVGRSRLSLMTHE